MLESKQMTEVYEVLSAEIDPEMLADDLFAYFRDKERAEIERLHAMLALFESDRCLSRRLAEWFGDTRAPEQCGHCSACRGQVARLPTAEPDPPLSSWDVGDLCSDFTVRLAKAGEGHPPTPDLLTRFLCGISTPLFTPMKARKLAAFAALEGYPYAEVRRRVAEHLAR